MGSGGAGSIDGTGNELQRPVQDDVALPVDGYHVIAVVEHDEIDRPRQLALQVGGIVEAGKVVLAGMQDEGRLGEGRDVLPRDLGEAAAGR